MSALAGKVVIVTGAGRGIGREIALAAAASGAKVVVADLGATLAGMSPDADVAEGVAAEIRESGGEAIAVADTVVTKQGAGNIVDAALAAWRRVDGLVCCAGNSRHVPFLDLSEEDFDAVVATHLKGHFLMFQSVLAAMVGNGNGGSLIGIGSGYVHGDPTHASYRAAKAGIVALTKSVAIAGKEHGVRANIVSPIADTRMTRAANLRFGSDAADIAPMAVYLLSDRSASVTGDLFGVYGNTISRWADAHEHRTTRHHQRWGQDDIDRIMPWLLGDSMVTMSRPTADETARSVEER